MGHVHSSFFLLSQGKPLEVYIMYALLGPRACLVTPEIFNMSHQKSEKLLNVCVNFMVGNLPWS